MWYLYCGPLCTDVLSSISITMQWGLGSCCPPRSAEVSPGQRMSKVCGGRFGGFNFECSFQLLSAILPSGNAILDCSPLCCWPLYQPHRMPFSALWSNQHSTFFLSSSSPLASFGMVVHWASNCRMHAGMQVIRTCSISTGKSSLGSGLSRGFIQGSAISACLIPPPLQPMNPPTYLSLCLTVSVYLSLSLPIHIHVS